LSLSLPNRSSYSLRRRLLGFLLMPLLALLGISIITDYTEGMHVANRAYDHALFSTALAVAARLDSNENENDIDLTAQAESVLRTDVADKVYFAVTRSNGSLIAGDKQLAAKATPAYEGNPSYHFDTMGGLPVRVATYRYRPLAGWTGDATIIVAETTHKRETAANRIMITTLWTDLLLIATSLVVVFFGIRYAMIPLDALCEGIRQREPEDLSPVNETSAPSEIRPLLSAINRLMSNLRDAGAAQQAFISSAAHQLRTPLAGLQTQLELIAENLNGETLARVEIVKKSASRLAHLTKQMLALARSSVDANPVVEMQAVELTDLLESAASDFLDTALQKNIDLGFEAAPAQIQGSGWMLRELLANLIDNALRYTPEGGHVTVRCGTDDHAQTYLEVEDNGPGIPEAAREKVFKRFTRLEEQSTEGSGLGLSIVKEVAKLHHAKVELRSGVGNCGLIVAVHFASSSGLQRASRLSG